MDLFWKVIIPFNLIFVISPSFDFGIDSFRYGLHLNRDWHGWISKLDQKQKPYCVDPKTQHRHTESNTGLWRSTSDNSKTSAFIRFPPGNSPGKVKGCASNDSFRNRLKETGSPSGQMSLGVLGSPLVVDILIVIGKSLMLLGVSWGLVPAL